MTTAGDTKAADASLYERLGGVCATAAVVDDFIDRIMDDPRLNANPKVDEAHQQVFLIDLRASLDKFSVPPAERAELFAIVDSTKKDIVQP